MTRIVNMILRQLLKTGADKIAADGQPLTREQKNAQKRVRKALKAAQRMHRI